MTPSVFPAPGWVMGTLVAAVALLSLALIHATVTTPSEAQPLPSPIAQSIARTGLADLCVSPYDDLRHPGWGRDEQTHIASPYLPDPRPARWFVRPVSWRSGQ